MNNTRLKSSILVTLFVSFLIVSCDTNNDPRRVDYSDVPEPFSIDNPVSVDTTESGLIIYVIEEGSGDLEVIPRDQISFYYTKRYKDDLDRIIASSYANGVTFPHTGPVTPTSTRSVISESQFREGVIGMVEGEKRVLVLTPPVFGYLGNSYTYTNDTLWIDIELDSIAL
ncbi:hypothetical protein [Gracilimonas sp.]|uniref:hypothetical protein n=1 Tax=Gracilimonas sp. TaxID=1974203 RepID=UPI003D142CC2